MAKRFTDTDKWKKASFCDLPPKMKLVWVYVCDNCDHAGIWDSNFKLLSFQLGYEVTKEEFTRAFSDKIVWLSPTKCFIPSFVEFQYGELNPANRAHQSVIHRLEKEGASKPLISPFQGAKEKEKDKDKEREGGVGETRAGASPNFTALAALLFAAVKKHPPGDESIANTVGPDWVWVSRSGVLPIVRQSKDDDWARKRIAGDLKTAHESIKAKNAEGA